MVTRRDYTADATAACRSVLIELSHLLGEFRNHMVIVGGWVPVLLITDAPEPHSGTLDLDLALDFVNIPEDTYQTVLKALASRGYRQDAAQPFRFFRTVNLPRGGGITVEVDFLAGEYGGTRPGRRTQLVQDIRARKARGCDLAFEDPVEVAIDGTLPGGGRDRVTVRVAGLLPWLVMKGMALHDRLKEKDAFDVYYAVRYFPGGPAELADVLRAGLEKKLVLEGLGKIRSKFLTIEDVGPKSVADFLEPRDASDRAILARDAYETVSHRSICSEFLPSRSVAPE